MRGLEQRRALMQLALATHPRSASDDAMVEAALEEEIAPLLGARVSAGELQAAGTVRVRLLRAYRACIARNLVIERELRPLFEALFARRIPALLLKGAALLRTSYLDPGRRSMSDVDVLVPRTRWREAIGVARELAWAAWADEHRPVTSRLDYVRALSRSGLTVEIHRSFSPRAQFAIDYDAIFARARPDADGVLLPEPVDLFVSLAIHAAKHAFILPLRSFVDGFMLVAGNQLDADEVISRARSWGACRATAAWLYTLVALGLDGKSWRLAALKLDPNQARPRAYLAETEAASHGWRFQRRILQLIDRPGRKLLWLGERAAFRLADYVLSPCMARLASA